MPDEYSTRPLIWFIVNLAVVLFSIALAIDIIVAVNHERERPGAVAEYLTYNFVTSAIWLVEVASNTYDIRTRKSHHSRASLVIEWIICLYYVWDSTRLLIKWKLNADDLGNDWVQAVSGIVTYAYMAAVSFLDYRKSRAGDSYRLIQEDEASAD
eukprot:jgi/Psemu1/46024/gm1.46024_g